MSMMMDTMLMKMRSNGEVNDDMFTWLRVKETVRGAELA